MGLKKRDLLASFQRYLHDGIEWGIQSISGVAGAMASRCSLLMPYVSGLAFEGLKRLIFFSSCGGPRI